MQYEFLKSAFFQHWLHNNISILYLSNIFSCKNELKKKQAEKLEMNCRPPSPQSVNLTTASPQPLYMFNLLYLQHWKSFFFKNGWRVRRNTLSTWTSNNSKYYHIKIQWSLFPNLATTPCERKNVPINWWKNPSMEIFSHSTLKKFILFFWQKIFLSILPHKIGRETTRCLR